MKIAVGEKVAGKFQYNRFAALMNNPEYYQKALGATQNADGMMDQMNEIYTESIEGRLNTLQTAGEQIISTLFNQDNIEPVIGAATDFLNVINKIIDTVGGGLPVFTALSSILLRTFNAQIGEQVARIATNIQTSMQAAKNVQQVDATFGLINKQDGAVGEIRKTLQDTGFAGLSENTQKNLTENAKQLLEAENKVADVKEKQELLQKQINTDLKNNSDLAGILVKDEFKQWEITEDNVVLQKEKLETMQLSGKYTEEEIKAQEKEVALAREQADIAEQKYDEAFAQIQVEKELSSYTLDELIAIDQENQKLGIKTNYAREYLQYVQEANQVEGEYNLASDRMRGLKERIDTEKLASGITN